MQTAEHNFGSNSGERGAVLILILAMVAVLSITAVSLVRVSARNTITASALLQKEQAELAAQSVIATGLVMLSQDDAEIDTFQEPWNRFSAAMQSLQHQVDGMTVSARILDASSRFNLNSLGSITSEHDEAAQIFLRMLHHVFPTISKENQMVLLWRIKDWIDGDTVEARWGRVETEAYASTISDARPVNRAFVSMSEVYAAMKGTPFYPVVTSQPFGFFFTTHMRTKVNINTATSVLLRSLFVDDAAGQDFAKDVAAKQNDEQAKLSGQWYIKSTYPKSAQSTLSAMGSCKSSVFFIDVVIGMPSVSVTRRVYVERSGTKVAVKFVDAFPVGELDKSGHWVQSEAELMKKSIKKG
ncbi:type II secretion system protein GspK [Halodesulfovibrio sp.]|jgi:type II secretory pathway component PulK|uniref:general secretion pathway protein GspK n=1 Tax=Halodesulfovibrio sp. TaxID=1912772 RepID=UPI0025E4645C|nr:type II secretion system protein GspK [Halodesulfovibrio sp.]MCT4625424.1 type II secretion system protein GspK [Halodesulfovibrio sp.]